MRSRTVGRNKKVVHNTSNQQIHHILHNILFSKSHRPPRTSFVFDREQSLQNLMTQLSRDCPELLLSKDIFLNELAKLYDQTQNSQTDSA